MSPRWPRQGALLLVSLVGSLAVSHVVVGAAALRAAVVGSLAGYLVTAAVARRVPGPLSLVAGVVVSALAAFWVAMGSTTFYGLPTHLALGRLDRSLRLLGPHFPLPPTAGAIFLCALVAGTGASVTRVLPGSQALVPALVLVCTSMVAVPTGSIGWIGLGLTVTAAVALLADRPGFLRLGSIAGTTVAAITGVVTVLALGLNEVAGAQGGGLSAEAVPPTALSLVSHLTELQLKDPNLVMFRAATPVPTYWQIASLSVLSGQTWRPDSATSAAFNGQPPPAASQPATGPSSFDVDVTIGALSSQLLPVPPGTVEVSSGVLSQIGVYVPAPSSPGEHYRATALVTTAGQAEQGEPAGTMPPAEDLALPAEPSVVLALARLLTASASTPLGKAEAITNWFRSGRFRYSLRPTGADLSTFLLSTRQGSCEQFAGAFAVLARAVGLPTRLALGFTTGRRDATGMTIVRGLDAHVWPQVLLGGQWTSFEPTPVLPAGELAPPSVIGTTATGTPNPVVPTTLPPHLPLPSTPRVVVPASASWAPWALGVTAVGIVALVVALAWVRRRRRSPAAEVLASWRRVERALRRKGLPRPPCRVPSVHARTVGSMRTTTDAATLEDLIWLADAVEGALYGAAPVDAARANAALAAGRNIARRVRAS